MNQPPSERVVSGNDGKKYMMLNKLEAAQWVGAKYRPDGNPFTIQTINRWMRVHRLPHVKIGQEVWIDADELEKWAKKQFRRGNWSDDDPWKNLR